MTRTTILTYTLATVPQEPPERPSMASNIDPSKPADDVPALKADLRANLQAAKDEIEALQGGGGGIPVGGTTGQVLKKASAADFDTTWGDDQTGASGSGLDYLLPEDFGCVAGDSTPATAASNETNFNTLFAEAVANSKSIEFHPHRTYYIGDGLKSGPQLRLSQHTDFMIRGNGAKLIRGNGVTLDPGGSGDQLLAFDRCRRFRVYDLIVDGNRDNVAPVDEFGHGFSIEGCYDGWLVNCEGNNTQGDGFKLTREFSGTLPSDSDERNCKRITMQGCRADNNNRQGLSVTECNGLDVIGGEYVNTTGTAPGAGIDLEPNPNGIVDSVTDVRIIGVRLEGNGGSGVKMANRGTGAIEDQGWIKRVTIMGCTFRDNGKEFDGDALSPIPAGMSIDGEDIQIVGNIFADFTTKASADTHMAVWSNRRPSYNVTIAHNTVRNVTACNSVLHTWHVEQFGETNRALHSITYRDNVIDVRTGMSSGGANETSTPQIARIRASGVDFCDNQVISDPTNAIIGVVFSNNHGTFSAAGARIDRNDFLDVQDGSNGVLQLSVGTPTSVSYNTFRMHASTSHTPIAGGNTPAREEGNVSINMAAARNSATT